MEKAHILPLVKVSRVAVVLQLLMIPLSIGIVITLGAMPKSAPEAFEMMAQNPFTGLIRADLYNIIMVSLYFFSFPGLFFLLKEKSFALSLLAIILTFTAVILVLSSHSGFSLYHLSQQYWAVEDESLRKELISAGEAVIAQNIWNSSAGYFAGIFLQGAGILISLAMIGDRRFTVLTIISGVAGNGLDLFQHLIHPFASSFSQSIMYVMGPFYLLWFIMLIWDFTKYIKVEKSSS